MENPFEVILKELREMRAILEANNLVVPAHKAEPVDKKMTADQAAEYLGISKRVLYSYVGRNKVPHRKAHGRLHFFQSELASYVDTHH